MMEPAKNYDLSGLKVLIVEDNDYIQGILRNLIRGLGVRDIELCGDGGEALKRIKANPFDIVLVDWDIPTMNGCDLTRAVRTQLGEDRADVSIIMVTASGDKDHVIRARDAGVDRYLVKPVSARALYDRIVSLIDDPQSGGPSPDNGDASSVRSAGAPRAGSEGDAAAQRSVSD